MPSPLVSSPKAKPRNLKKRRLARMARLEADPERAQLEREEHRDYNLLMRLAFPEKVGAQVRSWRRRNMEKWRAIRRRAHKKWKAKNRGHIREYKIRTREHTNRLERIRRARNPAPSISASHKRRAKLKLVETADCSEKIRTLQQKTHCYWCWSPMSKIEIDHVIPLVRDGLHAPDNLVASCVTCNRSKGAKLYWEWDEDLAS